MVNWLLIGVLTIAAVVLLKFKEIRHQLGIFVGLALLVFVVISFGHISATHDIDLKSFEGISQATKLYVAWLGQVFYNVGEVSSYAVKQNWDYKENNITSNPPSQR